MFIAVLSLILIIPISFLIIGKVMSAPHYVGEKSDHFNGKAFFNPSGANAKGLKDVLKWQTDQTRKRLPWVAPVSIFKGEKPTPSVSGGDLRVTFIGHSTVLIQMDSFNILTDPVWYDRTSPVQWAGPKRICPAGIRMEDLPTIHIIVQSHNHWDHLDIISLPKIYARDQPVIITSLGISQFLKNHGMPKCYDLDWWETIQLDDSGKIIPTDSDGKSLKITCLPAQHFSGRGIFDRNATLWSGFMISTPQSGNVYFVGDSGYGDFFKTIGEKFGTIRLALIPIGAYKPEWFMSPIHCSPDEAVQIHMDVKAEKSIAIHHSTFPLADDGQNEPLEALEKAKILRGVPVEDFVVLQEGQFIDIT